MTSTDLQKPHKLLGCIRFSTDKPCLPDPYNWVKLRCPPQNGVQTFGHFKTQNGSVMWFFDFTARDDFFELYGGTKVTLTRKLETITGDEAKKLLKGL